MKQVEIIVSGKVQGVFYRHYTCKQADKLGILGYVQNLVNGDVKIVAQGEESQVDQLITWAKSGSPNAQVQNLYWVSVENLDRFSKFTVRY